MTWPSGGYDDSNLVGTGSPELAAVVLGQICNAVNDIVTARDEVNGICPLDSTGHVPTSNLPVQPLTLGGTGASNAADALINLGLANLSAVTRQVGFGFRGKIAATIADNYKITQKVIPILTTCTLSGLHVIGIDGLDVAAVGGTIIYVNKTGYATPTGGLSLTLAAGAYYGSATGSLSLVSGDFLFVFITQATGGHFGLDGQLTLMGG